MHRRVISLVLFMALAATGLQAQNKRETAVREDKQKLAEDDSWFYDDLDAALIAAAKTKRPLMIVFR